MRCGSDHLPNWFHRVYFLPSFLPSPARDCCVWGEQVYSVRSTVHCPSRSTLPSIHSLQWHFTHAHRLFQILLSVKLYQVRISKVGGPRLTIPMPQPALLVFLAFAYPWKAGLFSLSVICRMLHDDNLGQRCIGFFADFHLATVLDPRAPFSG